jgi:ankyrin repeat protein
LHAAVNNGKIKIVEILLKSTNLNVNLVNDSCMSATALHLAVWHSYDEIAINLVRNKGDPYLKMGIDGLNAFELAKENDNQVLAELLLEFYNEEKNVRESISSSTSNKVFVKASVDLNNNKIVDKK